MSDVWNSDEEVDAVDVMTVEQIRAHVMQPNRCWADAYCDCVQQHAAERMLEHYDALAAERDRLQRLLDMRPPYYCPNCDCERCGNTRAIKEGE